MQSHSSDCLGFRRGQPLPPIGNIKSSMVQGQERYGAGVRKFIMENDRPSEIRPAIPEQGTLEWSGTDSGMVRFGIDQDALHGRFLWNPHKLRIPLVHRYDLRSWGLLCKGVWGTVLACGARSRPRCSLHIRLAAT